MFLVGIEMGYLPKMGQFKKHFCNRNCILYFFLIIFLWNFSLYSVVHSMINHLKGYKMTKLKLLEVVQEKRSINEN